MLTAINAIKLILLITLGVLYLAGLGWLIIGPLLHGSLINRKKEIPRFQEISLMMISGLIINYGITITLHSLKTSMIVGGILAALGIICFQVAVIPSFKQKSLSLNSFYKSGGIVLVCCMILVPIMTIPLKDWDALSIWFLHAKMIYAAGTFSQFTGWQHPSVLFSHVDYPNLVPALAAQITYLMGYWNEYLPKLSLFFVLIPAIMLLFSFFRRSFSFLFLILFIPFSFASRLSDGYMDGYLAMFFALSMLFLGKYYKENKPIDLTVSVFCLFPLLYLKNEGSLAVLAGICAILFVLLFNKNKSNLQNFFRTYWKLFLFMLVLVIPFLLWNFYKRQWGLTNDLELRSSSTFVRLMDRLNDGSYKLILDNTSYELQNGLMLLGILVAASFALKIRLPKEILPVIIGATVYCLGIMAVYLITPYDLEWHLHQSVYRTLLTTNTGIYIASYYLVNSLEQNEDKRT